MIPSLKLLLYLYSETATHKQSDNQYVDTYFKVCSREPYLKYSLSLHTRISMHYISKEFNKHQINLQSVSQPSVFNYESPKGNILYSGFPTQSPMNVLEKRPEHLFVEQLGKSEFQGTYFGRNRIQGLFKSDQEKQRCIQHRHQLLWNGQN